VAKVEGQAGNFNVTLAVAPRYVDPDKCIACGECAAKCPKRVPDPFNAGLSDRKAAYILYGQTVPLKYAVDPEHCIYLAKGKCRACEKVCPTKAVNLDQTGVHRLIKVGAIVLAPGFKTFDPSHLDYLGLRAIPDVVTSLEYERLLSSSGPNLGHLRRPSDGAEPRKVAWIQCVGSRSLNQCDNAYCSGVCCMAAVKQALLTAEHAKEIADRVIYCMDMRTHGKNFESYYEKAQAQGVRFLRSRPHTLAAGPEGRGVSVRYASEARRELTLDFDMVVLSVGLEAPRHFARLAETMGIALNDLRFAATQDLAPVATSRPGIYVCGCFAGPKDIPQSVVEASAAACAAAGQLVLARGAFVPETAPRTVIDVTGEPPRLGVFVCSCGTNIAGVVDVARLAEGAAKLPHVVHVENALFACAQDFQERISEAVRERGLNRVVVAACTPRTHEPLFQETIASAGLNKYLFEMANIRNQASWVHADDPAAATDRAMDQVRMAAAKAVRLRPLCEPKLSVIPRALIVGGGLAGMTAALELAKQEFQVHIVERQAELGGNARSLRATLGGQDVAMHLARLRRRVEEDERITVHLGKAVAAVTGYVGRFATTLAPVSGQGETEVVEHGAAILAVGGLEAKANDYGHGKHHRIMTHLEIDRALRFGSLDPYDVGTAVFIQCVGSREPHRPYCSRLCCTHTLKTVLYLKEKNPDLRAFVLYRDMRPYGERELLYQKARELGVIFIRFELETKPWVVVGGDDITVYVKDHILGDLLELPADILGLATGIVPSDASDLARMFKVPLDADGWLVEAHAKLRPVDFATDGVFMAGMAHYPKPIEEAVAQAQAAAGRAGALLARKEITLPGLVSRIDTGLCSGCGVCLAVCPYGAISRGDNNLAVVNEALCKGCGLCAACCRSGAPSLFGFTDADILAQVDAMFGDHAC
jgi:heterodisulfide reductase subunit A